MKKIIRQILREEFKYKQQLFDLLRTGDEDNLEMVKMISQGQGIDVAELLIEYFKENPKPPYFKILNHFELPDGVIADILSNLFEQPVSIYTFYDEYDKVNDDYGNLLYYEDDYGGYWEKYEYDDYGNLLYEEDSNGVWKKYEYDQDGNMTYFHNSRGYWSKTEYDENGSEMYSVDSNGYWERKEYAPNGNLIYYEDFTGSWYKNKYDENGNLIYVGNSDGHWYRKEYDENNNQIYYEDSYGYIEDKR